MELSQLKTHTLEMRPKSQLLTDLVQERKRQHDNKRAVRQALQGSSTLPSTFSEMIYKFMSETSLHGLKYITETMRHSMERIFWLVTVSAAWIFAGYMIYQVESHARFEDNFFIV